MMHFQGVVAVFLLSLTLCNGDPSKGTQFVAAFLPNIGDGVTLYLIISNDNNATVYGTLTSPFASFGQPQSLVIFANTVVRLPVQPVSLQIQPNILHEQHEFLTEDKGLILNTSLPVTVYGHSDAEYEGDSFQVLPVNQLGTEYYTLVGGIIHQSNYFVVIAAQPQTTVTVDGRSIMINAGQTLSFASFSLQSGDQVTSDKPVAVISGCACSEDTYGNGCGMQTTMLLPTSAWGTQFPLVPLRNPDPANAQWHLLRVVGNRPSTVLTIDGAPLVTLMPGQSFDFNITIPTMLQSSAPVQVVQIGRGKGEDLNNNAPGDEFFVQAQAVEHFVSQSITFYPTGYYVGPIPTTHYLRLITSLQDSGKLSLDGTLIGALQFHRVGRSNYYSYETDIPLGTHVIGVTGNAKYSAVIYSYGFATGAGVPLLWNVPKH